MSVPKSSCQHCGERIKYRKKLGIWIHKQSKTWRCFAQTIAEPYSEPTINFSHENERVKQWLREMQ